MKRRINEHSSLRNPQCCCQDNDDGNNNFDDDDDLLLGFERQMAKDYEMDGEAQTEKSERYIAATIITIIAIIITIIIAITIIITIIITVIIIVITISAIISNIICATGNHFDHFIKYLTQLGKIRFSQKKEYEKLFRGPSGKNYAVLHFLDK